MIAKFGREAQVNQLGSTSRSWPKLAEVGKCYASLAELVDSLAKFWASSNLARLWPTFGPSFWRALAPQPWPKLGRTSVAEQPLDNCSATFGELLSSPESPTAIVWGARRANVRQLRVNVSRSASNSPGPPPLQRKARIVSVSRCSSAEVGFDFAVGIDSASYAPIRPSRIWPETLQSNPAPSPSTEGRAILLICLVRRPVIARTWPKVAGLVRNLTMRLAEGPEIGRTRPDPPCRTSGRSLAIPPDRPPLETDQS